MSLSGSTGTMSGIAISPTDSEALSKSLSATSGRPFHDFDLNVDDSAPVAQDPRNPNHEKSVGKCCLRLLHVHGARQSNDLFELSEKALHAKEFRPIPGSSFGALDASDAKLLSMRRRGEVDG